MFSQIAQIPEGTARRDALRLTKKKAKSLPRVTAYATAAYVPSNRTITPRWQRSRLNVDPTAFQTS